MEGTVSLNVRNWVSVWGISMLTDLHFCRWVLKSVNRTRQSDTKSDSSRHSLIFLGLLLSLVSPPSSSSVTSPSSSPWLDNFLPWRRTLGCGHYSTITYINQNLSNQIFRTHGGHFIGAIAGVDVQGGAKRLLDVLSNYSLKFNTTVILQMYYHRVPRNTNALQSQTGNRVTFDNGFILF